MKEYYSLIGLDCSPMLRDRLDRAFCLFERPEPGRYAFISPGYDGRCRILGEDGYCLMQRECGEGVLPEVCRFYPRAVKHGRDGEKNFAVFSAGCENTVELLMNTDRLDFSEERIVIPGDDIPADAGYVLTGDAKAAMYAAVACAQDRNLSFAGRMKALCCPGSDSTADRIAVFAALIRFISRLACSSHNIHDFGLEALACFGIDIDDPDSADFAAVYGRYVEAVGYARSRVEHIDRNFENLLVNHICYTLFPFIDGVDRSDCSSALCALFAMLDIICFGWIYSHRDDDISVAFADSVSAVFRMAEHSDYYRTAALLLRALRVTASDISVLL